MEKKFNKKEYMKEFYRLHKKEMIDYSRKWRLKLKTENPEKYRLMRKMEKKNHPEWNKSLGARYSQYKTRAKREGIIFGLSLEDFKKFWQKPCYYCGSEIGGVGVDRKNNNLGYLINNCVPCCIVCNRAKRTMTEEEFVEHCRKVVVHYFQPKTP